MNRIYNYIIIAIFLFVTIQSLSAYEIQKMSNQIYINTDGSADVKVNVNFSTNSNVKILQLPLIFGNININNATFDSATENVNVRVISNNVFKYMEVPLLLESGNHQLTINYRIENYLNWKEAGPGEFNKYEFETSVENTFLTTIDTFNLCTVLPKGWNYHKVTGSAPEFKKKDPKPPYTLNQVDGRFCATISRTPMGYRDKVALEFIFKNTKKSYAIVYIGIILIGLYLFFFRNLVENKKKSDVVNKDKNNFNKEINKKGETNAK